MIIFSLADGAISAGSYPIGKMHDNEILYRSYAKTAFQDLRMGPIHFRWIEAFRAVARTGSTTDAAEFLKIDQSAVSRHIKALEGQLGLMLFERRQRGLRLTSDGSELLSSADGAIDGLRRFQSHARELGKSTGGHLHILTSATLARGLFPDVVRNFRYTHRDVTIEIEVVARSELEHKVEMQQFDVASPPRSA